MRWAALAAVAGLGAAGIALSAYGITTPAHVQPPLPQVVHSDGAGAGPGRAVPEPTTTSDPTATVAPPPPSAPVDIVVAALDISSPLGPARGLKPDGTVDDAPLSGPTWSLPWWYDGGPAPGQDGSAVILGHVDSALGAGHLGVFFRLGDLQPGQAVEVALADGTTTHWVVDSTVLYLDGRFPDAVVYARSGGPALRLVTCGGTFDWQTGHYESATVVTASPAHTGRGGNTPTSPQGAPRHPARGGP